MNKKPKLLYLPNTWEMILNVEKDLQNLQNNYPNDYLKSKVGRKSKTKNR